MSARLTDSQITEGLRLAGEATPGPWEWRDGGYADLAILRAPSSEVCNFGNCEQYYPTEGTEPNAADKALIAHAGTHYAAALAEVQALRGQVRDALAYIEPRCVEEREVIQGYVTRDMATDAGEPMMEGEPVTGVETIEHEEWIELAAILRGVK